MGENKIILNKEIRELLKDNEDTDKILLIIKEIPKKKKRKIQHFIYNLASSGFCSNSIELILRCYIEAYKELEK